MAEYAGTQIWIQPTEYPAFQFRIFHVALVSGLDVGDAVAEGQLLGHHGGDETMSDIAVCVATPGGSRLVSYFDVMSDALFQQYQARGVLSRSQLIITKQERDADPLTCDGETFTSSGHLENWVQLAPARIQAVPAQETGPARQPAMDASKPYRLHPQHLGRPPGVGRG
jgi:hypothetical protein